jgi:hypothetical protein
VQRDRPGLVRITVGTPGWDGEQVPRHTDISFEPSGELYGLTSGGSAGHFDYFDLDSAKVRAWVHDFTAGSKMTLSFPDEAAWSFDLTGTSPTISAMLQCVTDNNIADLPAPFALAAQPEMPSRPTPAQIAPPATETRATAINQNAGAAIIKLMCDYQYVICRPNRSPPCSEPKSDQIFLPLDLTKHTVRNNPAEITDDYIRWGGLRHSYGIDNVTASINRKTGAFSSETETTYPDGNQLTNTWTGECQIAPANKF